MSLVLAFAWMALQTKACFPPPNHTQVDHVLAHYGSIAHYPGSETEEWTWAVTYDIDERKVQIEWFFHATEAGGAKARVEQHLELSFYPTAICQLPHGKLAVGGLDPSTGHSLIEVWQVRRPWKVDMDSGETILVGRSVAEAIRIHDLPTSGKRVPNLMTPLGAQSVFLIRFSDGHDVYSFDSSRPDAKPKRIATQVDGYLDSPSAKSRTKLGDAAIFGSRMSVLHVVFIDSDRDGDIDSIYYPDTDPALDRILNP